MNTPTPQGAPQTFRPRPLLLLRLLFRRLLLCRLLLLFRRCALGFRSGRRRSRALGLRRASRRLRVLWFRRCALRFRRSRRRSSALRLRRASRGLRVLWFRRRTLRFRSSRSRSSALGLRRTSRVGLWMRGRLGWMRGWRAGRWLSRGTFVWGFIRRPCRFGRDDGVVGKCSRLWSRSDCWFALVHGSPLLRVRVGRLRMLGLSGYRRSMCRTCRNLILSGWTRGDPTSATVEADPGHRGALDHRGVVNVVNVGNADVVHRTVIEKLSVLPASTLVALTGVAEAVTDPPIETYLRTPVALIEGISAVTPTPIGWSPEQTGFRSHHPCTRHPVVIVEVVAVSPVARRPEITRGGTKRLLVDGQFRRGETDRNADLRERRGRHGQHYERKQY